MSISINNLNYHIGQKHLLRDISLVVNLPKLIGIIGANGAGKSTLLNCISGLNNCNNSIKINDKLIEDYDPQSLSRCRAVLTQQTTLNFPFKAKEIVAMSFALDHLNDDEKQRIIQHCLAIVSAEHLAERNFLNLSGGEKQRIHIARVFAQLLKEKPEQPQILLLDEPTAPLDLKYQYQLFDRIKTMTTHQLIVLTVIHDLNLAASYCDELWVMKAGSLLNKGHPKDVITQSMLKEVFDVDLSVSLNKHTPYIYKTL